RRRRRVAFLDDVEMVIERRHFVHLGHREAHLLRERDEMRGAQAAVPVLDAVQVLDQQVAAARRVAQQLAHLRERLGVDGPALGMRTNAPARAEARNVDGNGSHQCRKSQYLSTYAARSRECWRTRRSASSVSRFSIASMMRM